MAMIARVIFFGLDMGFLLREISESVNREAEKKLPKAIYPSKLSGLLTEYLGGIRFGYNTLL